MTTDGCISALDVRPDRGVLLVGRQRGCIQAWDLVEGRVIAQRLEHGDSRVAGVRFSPNGAYLAAVTEAGTLTIWDGATFEPIERIEAEPSGALGVAFSRDGALVGTVGRAGDAHLWDPATGALAYVTPKTDDGCGPAYALTFLRGTLVVGHQSGVIATWREHAQRVRGPDLYGKPGGLRAFGREVYALASCGELVVAGGNQGGGVLLYQGSGDWPCIARIKVPRPMAVNALAISPDHQRVAAACSDGVVRTADFGGYLATLCKPDAHGSSLGSGALGEPSVLPEQTLGREVHRDWTSDAIVSQVAFVGQSIIVSGHFDGAVRFWFKRGASRFMLEATLRLQGAGAKLMTGEGLGEHEREATWSSLFPGR